MNQSETAQRKSRSIEILKRNGVPYILHLPEIEAESETVRRSDEEVGLRVICLALVSMKAAGSEDSFVHAGIEHYDVGESFSPIEREFMFNSRPSEQQRIQLQWRVEAANALLWAVGLEEHLSFPVDECDWNAFWARFHADERATFLGSLHLRPQSQLLDEADLIYRLHHAVRAASLRGDPMPSGLNQSVVMERHYALNWLVVHTEDDCGWDEVATDT